VRRIMRQTGRPSVAFATRNAAKKVVEARHRLVGVVVVAECAAARQFSRGFVHAEGTLTAMIPQDALHRGRR